MGVFYKCDVCNKEVLLNDSVDFTRYCKTDEVKNNGSNILNNVKLLCNECFDALVEFIEELKIRKSK